MFHEPGSGGSYQKLLNAAESGDPDAAYDLFMKLAACCHVPREAGEFEKHLGRIRVMETADTIDGHPVARGGTAEDARRAAEASIAFATRAREFRLSVPEERLAQPEIVKWLHRAAEGGNLSARANMLMQQGSFGDARLTPETIDDQTREFLRSLEAAALDGHVFALTAMSNFHFAGHLVARDAARSYAYFAAESLISGGRDMEPQEWVLRHSSHPYAKLAQITPDEVDRANSLKRKIVSRAKK